MSEPNDSIQKLLSDLPQYTAEDFIDYAPYERAEKVCSTKEEMEECLDKIYDVAKKLNVDENYTMNFDHICMEDFLIAIGEKEPVFDPPEEVLEISRLSAENEDLRNKLRNMFFVVQNQSVERENSEETSEGRSNIPQEMGFQQKGYVQTINIGGRKITLRLDNYSIDEETGGIYKKCPLDDSSSRMDICDHFVYPSAFVRSRNGETVNLTYFRDGEWHTLRSIKRSDLHSSSKIGNLLLDSGLDVNIEASGIISGYFAEVEKLNRRMNIPVVYAVDSLGWAKNNTEFAPYGNYEHDGSNNLKRLFEGVSAQRGSLDGWKNTICQIRDGQHVPARIVIAASFASVLIRPFDGMRFIIDIIGKSGIGKSVALRAAAGVWGDPDRYIARFDSTESGAMLRSNYLSDLPLILDESETKKSQTDYDEFIYTMCGDYDRVKATNDYAPPISKNCIFISGEHNLLKDDSNAGAKNRVVDLLCENYIFFDENGNNLFVPMMNDNYGYAGREFVRCLLSEGGFQHAREVYDKHLTSFPSNRQARIPAVILAADELIDEWLFHDGIVLTAEQLMPYLRTKATEEENRVDYARIHESVEQWIMKEIEESGEKETANGKMLPKRGSRKAAYAFKDNVLERITTEAGGDTDTYVKWAEKNQKLAAGNDTGHKFKRQVTFDDCVTWCYAVFIPEGD